MFGGLCIRCTCLPMGTHVEATDWHNDAYSPEFLRQGLLLNLWLHSWLAREPLVSVRPPQTPPQCWSNRSPGVELRPLCLCSKNLIHRTILPLTISLKHGLCWLPNIPSVVTSYTLTVAYYIVSKTLLLKRIKQKHLKFQITFTKYKTDFIN